MQESKSRYNINIRRKEAIVHSVLDCQHDIKDHIKTVKIFQDNFNANVFLPAAQSLKTNPDSAVQSLENITFNSLLNTLLLNFESTQAKLNRTIEIVLAHSEEIRRSDIPIPYPEPVDQGDVSFIQDRLFLLPLEVDVAECHEEAYNHLVNPSEYTPDDEGYAIQFDLTRCDYTTEPFVYLRNSESIHNSIAPNFKSPFKAPDELNKFYCCLPPPSDVHSYIPSKSDALDKYGSPFFKKLQVNCCIYGPEEQVFAKVIAWDETKVDVEIISKFLAFPDVFPSSRIRQKETWSFGTFCIALSYLNPERKHLAYVSPYTRAHSHPFRKDPEPCAPEQVIANKRKHN